LFKTNDDDGKTVYIENYFKVSEKNEDGIFYCPDIELLPDNVRLTKFGRLLRSTSLDELPELWNIFKGDMSIVGPRPLLVRYLPYYTEEERHRHDIRPGMTGLSQVSGRNLLTWDDRLGKDLEYVRNISLREDARILVLTVKKVFGREDIVVDVTKLELRDFDVERKEQYAEH